MTKRRKNYNIRHKRGGKIDSITANRRKPAHARPISTGAAAVVQNLGGTTALVGTIQADMAAQSAASMAGAAFTITADDTLALIAPNIGRLGVIFNQKLNNHSGQNQVANAPILSKNLFLKAMRFLHAHFFFPSSVKHPESWIYRHPK